MRQNIGKIKAAHIAIATCTASVRDIQFVFSGLLAEGGTVLEEQTNGTIRHQSVPVIEET